MQIERLTLHSFKGFQDFEVNLKAITCLVGMNSKGKTTVLHAIRLLHSAFRFVFGDKDELDFDNPRWETNPSSYLSRHTYDDPSSLWLNRNVDEPCRIELSASNGVGVELVILGYKKIRVQASINGEIVDAQKLQEGDVRNVLREFYNLNPIFIPPGGQVSPSEPLLNHGDTIQRIENGRLLECWRSYLYWLCNDGDQNAFDSVVQLLQRYLPETEVLKPKLSHDNPMKVLVHFKENNTKLDISNSGSGMRTLLGLAVNLEFAESGCLMFDEPDTHLHGTLQRAIAHMLQDFSEEHGKQVIIATHAPDFISEMPVDSLLWIDRSKTTAQSVNSLGITLNELGSLSVIDAASSPLASKVLFLEGGVDMRVLGAVLGPLCRFNPFTDSDVIKAILPSGKGDAAHLDRFSELLASVYGRQPDIAALLDNDYEIPAEHGEELASTVAQFRLPRKEVENFLIEPAVFTEAINFSIETREKYTGSAQRRATIEEVVASLTRILSDDDIRNRVKYQVTPRYEDELSKKMDRSDRRRKSEEWFESKWSVEEWRINNCPGKIVLKALRAWAKSEFKATVTTIALAQAAQSVDLGLRDLAGKIVDSLYPLS